MFLVLTHENIQISKTFLLYRPGNRTKQQHTPNQSKYAGVWIPRLSLSPFNALFIYTTFAIPFEFPIHQNYNRRLNYLCVICSCLTSVKLCGGKGQRKNGAWPRWQLLDSVMARNTKILCLNINETSYYELSGALTQLHRGA